MGKTNLLPECISYLFRPFLCSPLAAAYKHLSSLKAEINHNVLRI